MVSLLYFSNSVGLSSCDFRSSGSPAITASRPPGIKGWALKSPIKSFIASGAPRLRMPRFPFALKSDGGGSCFGSIARWFQVLCPKWKIYEERFHAFTQTVNLSQEMHGYFS